MRNYSGKLLIAAMLLAALAAAGASWWFRYEATHQAAQFWGPEAARLIRDAPEVELLTVRSTTPHMILRSAEPAQSDVPASTTSPAANSPSEETRFGQSTWIVETRRDISTAPGLTHLRNALLEDRSFTWGTYLTSHDEEWTTAIMFRENAESEPLSILFLPSFARAIVYRPGDERPKGIGTQPISTGLAETINDWLHLPVGDNSER